MMPKVKDLPQDNQQILTKEEIRLKIENLKKQELHRVLHPEGTLEDHCWWCNQIGILREQLKK